MIIFFRSSQIHLVLFLISFFALLKAEPVPYPQWENIEKYFPQISDIITTMDSNSPSLLQNRESVNEASFQRMIVDSELGITANLNLNSHSIHEKRDGGSYYQRYRTVGSVYVKKPFFH